MIVLPRNIFLPRKQIDAYDAQNVKSTIQNNKPQRYLIIQPHQIVNLACIMEQSKYKFFLYNTILDIYKPFGIFTPHKG